MKQRNRAVEYCMRSYLADKHTHMEAPIGVKKPYLGMRSMNPGMEERYNRGVIRVKWIGEREGRGGEE